MEFLRGLVARGLTGVRLAVTDEHQDRKAAIERVLACLWQRCTDRTQPALGSVCRRRESTGLADAAVGKCLRGLRARGFGIARREGDFRRFAHPRELMSYLGLMPSEYSSGDPQDCGHLTKTGNRHVRRLMVEAAWHYQHRPRLSSEPPQAASMSCPRSPPALAGAAAPASSPPHPDLQNRRFRLESWLPRSKARLVPEGPMTGVWSGLERLPGLPRPSPRGSDRKLPSLLDVLEDQHRAEGLFESGVRASARAEYPALGGQHDVPDRQRRACLRLDVNSLGYQLHEDRPNPIATMDCGDVGRDQARIPRKACGCPVEIADVERVQECRAHLWTAVQLLRGRALVKHRICFASRARCPGASAGR